MWIERSPEMPALLLMCMMLGLSRGAPVHQQQRKPAIASQSGGGDSCVAALAKACGTKRSDVFACAECAGAHQHALQAAGCGNDAIAAWCAGAAPSPAPPQQLAAFRGSRLITDTAWGRQLNTWAGMEGREWSLCCSTFEGCDTGAKFHAACDAHTPTLTVAHNTGGTNDKGEKNPGNFTFGGFVRSPLPACGLRS